MPRAVGKAARAKASRAAKKRESKKREEAKPIDQAMVDGFAPRGEDADPFEGIEAPEVDPRAEAMARVAERFKAWRPASEVLTAVRAVPTIFPQYDRATRVGGHPIERWTTIHGPSNHGKTAFVHGLGLSFLGRGHYYGYVDAEFTTPEDWLRKLMAGQARSRSFLALRPDTYEQTVDAVRELLDGIAAARAAGDIDGSTSGLVVVDSMRKLVPEDILSKIKKHGATGKRGSIDGMGGRAAQIKAAMNASWLDELTPKLYRTGTAMAAIVRETEDPNADLWAKLHGLDFKVTGGKAVIFDASLLLRVERDKWVRESDADDARIVGERHRVTIRKTKIGAKEGRDVVCWFHSSNGVLVPEGFDRARDVLEMAIGYGIVEVTGGWYRWQGHRWQGASAAVKKLHARPDALAELEGQVRDRFRTNEELPTAPSEEES
jgi:RecA/RadA recombinase